MSISFSCAFGTKKLSPQLGRVFYSAEIGGFRRRQSLQKAFGGSTNLQKSSISDKIQQQKSLV